MKKSLIFLVLISLSTSFACSGTPGGSDGGGGIINVDDSNNTDNNPGDGTTNNEPGDPNKGQTTNDSDNDGVADDVDNCPEDYNPDQTVSVDDPELNPKKKGDACVEVEKLGYFKDYDSDGVINYKDNCPLVSNADQADSDNDGIGDACDNCPSVANAKQQNLCDQTRDDFTGSKAHVYLTTDTDKDGVPDYRDNCKIEPNADQADSDNDGIGDECDNCPNAFNPHQVDSDVNGTGDACELVPAGPQCVSTNECKQHGDNLICAKSVCVCDNTQAQFERLMPSVVLVLDASGSMRGSRTTILKNSLVSLADKTWSTIRYGVVIYSSYINRYTSEIKVYKSSDALKNEWSSYSANGGTATSTGIDKAIDIIKSSSSGDAEYDKRGKVIVVVTDGDPNCSSCVVNSVNKAKAEHIDTIFVGVDLNSHTIGLLNQAQSQALNTKNFVNATDENTLASEIQKAATSASCDISLASVPQDPNQIWVYYDNTIQERNKDWEYEAGKQLIKFKGETCEKLRTAERPQIEIILGCAGTCKITDNYFSVENNYPAEKEYNDAKMRTWGVDRFKYCDYIDNDCDGKIDEGCSACKGEICGNNLDDDCDGEIDNGCDIGKKGDACKRDKDCRGSFCIDGTCTEVCRPDGTECNENAECCSNTCDPNSGQCVNS